MHLSSMSLCRYESQISIMTSQCTCLLAMQFITTSVSYALVVQKSKLITFNCQDGQVSWEKQAEGALTWEGRRILSVPNQLQELDNHLIQGESGFPSYSGMGLNGNHVQVSLCSFLPLCSSIEYMHIVTCLALSFQGKKLIITAGRRGSCGFL